MRRSLSTTARLDLASVMCVMPLTQYETGRGAQISAKRQAELEVGCLRALRAGYTQFQICQYLDATRSRVSRWCAEAVKSDGDHSDHSRLNTRTKTEVQRLFDRISFDKPEECWTWTGSLKANGYGGFNFDRDAKQAHRAVYEAFVGPIDEGKEIDHICRNRRCVNPRHLKQVWPSENMTWASVRKAAP